MGNRPAQIKFLDRNDIRKIVLLDETKSNSVKNEEQKCQENLHRVCTKLASLVKPYNKLFNILNPHDHIQCIEKTSILFCEVACLEQIIFDTKDVFPEDGLELTVKNGYSGAETFEDAILQLLLKECRANSHYIDLFDKCPNFVAFALSNEIVSAMLKVAVNIFDDIKWPDDKVSAFANELKNGIGFNTNCNIVLRYLTVRYIRRLVLTLYTMDLHKTIEKILNKYNEMADLTYL